MNVHRWLLVGAAASALWAEVDRCSACETTRWPLALLGAAGYGALSLLTLWRRLHGWVTFGLSAAAGIHGRLALLMAGSGLWCVPCLLAAGCCVLAFVCCLRRIRRKGWLLLPILPALIWPAQPAPAADVAVSRQEEQVHIVVYIQDSCSFCAELRDRVMPVLEREFGSRIRVSYRDAREYSIVRRTPTLVLRGRTTRMIEGLPELSALREAVQEVAPWRS
jgi:hypothetical protein